MINHRISADWSTTKPIAAFFYTPRAQGVHTKAEVVHVTPDLLGFGILFNCNPRKCIAKHMINPRISSDWRTSNPIAVFSCTSRVQEVHTKAVVVHLTPCLLGLVLLFNCHA